MALLDRQHRVDPRRVIFPPTCMLLPKNYTGELYKNAFTTPNPELGQVAEQYSAPCGPLEV